MSVLGSKGLGSKPNSNKEPPCMWAYVTSMVKRSPTGMPGSLKKWLPGLVSSWSCKHGSKLRDPSQNSPCVALKRKVNITKVDGYQQCVVH
ncbi:hypothetical protein AVEN_275493-1 [Araneus ventricosus]|uniref:Uncharacterized protein n=1 Tax=Araneus ventricosus TaxID=182803 RepID=A0A4Y2LA64_ARAVE|nr:hypothetical protein AVEN_275493-1 [Araneus ventricosus]